MLVFDWLTGHTCQRRLGDRPAGHTWKLAQVGLQSKEALIKFPPWPADVEYLTLWCVESSRKQPDLIAEGQLRSERQYGARWVRRTKIYVSGARFINVAFTQMQMSEE